MKRIQSISTIFAVIIMAFGLFVVPKTALGFSNFDDEELLPPYTVGPGGGGALYHPAINPHDSDNIFITCDMGSSFVSCDGGKTFKPLLLGRSAAYSGMPRWWFTPHDENTVYATVGTIVYVSRDKGLSWDFLFPSKDDYAGLAHTGTSTAVGNVQPHFKTGTLQANYCLMSFYAHPTDKNILYALSAGKSYGYGGISGAWSSTIERSATVYWTQDGGKTWEVFKELTGRAIWVDQLQGNAAQMTLFQDELRIVTHQALFRIDTASRDIIAEHRIDSAQYFGSAGFGGNSHIVIENNQMTVYMTMWEGTQNTEKYANQICKSTDFGQTWQPITTHFLETARTLQGRTFHQHLYDTWIDNAEQFMQNKRVTFRFAAAVGEKLYVSFSGGDWRVDGLAMTENDGESWTLLYLGANKVQRASMGGYENQYTHISPIDARSSNTSFSGTNGKGLIVNEHNPNQIIITNMIDAYMTLDGGETWSNLASCRTDGGSEPVPAANETPFWTTTGIEPAGQGTLAINPFDLNHHLTGWTDIGMFESFDGGKSWTYRTVSGLPSGNCHAIAFNPHKEGVVLAAFTSRQSAVLADIVSVNSPDAARAGGMARSTDGGKIWAISYLGEATTNLLTDPNNSGLPLRAIINGIVFDPLNNDIVYALCSGAGVYKSSDGGITWTYFNNGIALQTHTVGGVTQQGIYGNIRLGKDNKTLFLTNDGIAYKLDIHNQANVWIPLNSPDNTKINRIEMDEEGNLYATTSLQLLSNNAIPFNGSTRSDVGLGGAYVSADNGNTWQQIFDEIYQVTDIKSDSRNSNLLYLTARMGKIYTSDKGTETTMADWSEAEGFHFHHPTQIFEDPQDQNRFYVATNCGGTWSIPIPQNHDTTNTTTNHLPDEKILKIYPNPTNGKLTINNEQLTIENVEIYDMQGRLLQSGTTSLRGTQCRSNPEKQANILDCFANARNDEVVIDVSYLENGIYFVKINEKVVKIIKN